MDLKNTQKAIVLVHMQGLHFLILNLKLLMKMMSMNSSALQLIQTRNLLLKMPLLCNGTALNT